MRVTFRGVILGTTVLRTEAPLPARQYQNEQEPFIENSDYIIAHAVRISRRAQLIYKNLMPDRPSRRALKLCGLDNMILHCSDRIPG